MTITTQSEAEVLRIIGIDDPKWFVKDMVERSYMPKQYGIYKKKVIVPKGMRQQLATLSNERIVEILQDMCAQNENVKPKSTGVYINRSFRGNSISFVEITIFRKEK